MTKSRGIRNTKDRSAAKAAGEKYYMSWIPCKRGHIAKRQTSNGTCIACSALLKSDRDQSYYAKHGVKIRAKVQKYRLENKEVVAERDKEKWLRNRQKNLDQCKVRSARQSAKRRINREYEVFMERMESSEGQA